MKAERQSITEGALKRALMLEMRHAFPTAVAIRHEDYSRSGTPDISFTWNWATTWIEVKHVAPRLKGKGIQELTCKRLAQVGRCVYVLYEEKVVDEQYTKIVEPKNLHTDSWLLCTSGFDHRLVIDYLRGAHRYDQK